MTTSTEEPTAEKETGTAEISDVAKKQIADLQKQLDESESDRKKLTDSQAKLQAQASKLEGDLTSSKTALQEAEANADSFKESLASVTQSALEKRKVTLAKTYGLESKTLESMDDRQLDAVEATRPKRDPTGYDMSDSNDGTVSTDDLSTRDKFKTGLERKQRKT